MRPVIKICGLTRQCDIDAVNAARPEYVGFVFVKHRLQVSASHAKVLRRRLSPEIVPVGVFVNERIEQIISLVRGGVIDAIQLHGEEDEEYINTLKALTTSPVIKAVSVLKKGDVEQWLDTRADYILLDSKGGATGKLFDWHLIGNVPRPFFLAGGLNVQNIDAAIEQVRPYAVDISSGVETGGLKDPTKINELIRRIRND